MVIFENGKFYETPDFKSFIPLKAQNDDKPSEETETEEDIDEDVDVESEEEKDSSEDEKSE